MPDHNGSIFPAESPFARVMLAALALPADTEGRQNLIREISIARAALPSAENHDLSVVRRAKMVAIEAIDAMPGARPFLEEGREDDWRFRARLARKEALDAARAHVALAFDHAFPAAGPEVYASKPGAGQDGTDPGEQLERDFFRLTPGEIRARQDGLAEMISTKKGEAAPSTVCVEQAVAVTEDDVLAEAEAAYCADPNNDSFARHFVRAAIRAIKGA